METNIETLPIETPDSAAVFAVALSLWQECLRREQIEKKFNLSAAYHGFDQFMREVMRVASHFETWSCEHINFAALEDVWPYMLQGRFGETCLAILSPTELAAFDDHDCLHIAMRLRLPVKHNDALPLPVDVVAVNPVANSTFKEFRIQTVRDSAEDDNTCPYTSDDDPFDPEFDPPYFGLYGVLKDGELEHIADRHTYASALKLAKNLVSGIQFPPLS